MATEQRLVGSVADLPPGKVTEAGRYVVGNVDGQLVAVGRRCRHFGADLAKGSLDGQGRLVCPWHQSAYTFAPAEWCAACSMFARLPGLGWTFRTLTGFAVTSRQRGRACRLPLRTLTTSCRTAVVVDRDLDRPAVAVPGRAGS
jgi:hypothetical protein